MSFNIGKATKKSLARSSSTAIKYFKISLIIMSHSLKNNTLHLNNIEYTL